MAIPDFENREVILPIGETASFSVSAERPVESSGGTFSWTTTGGTLVAAGRTATLTNMTPGKYTVTLTYAIGGKTCSTTIMVVFVAAQSITMSIPDGVGLIDSGVPVTFWVTSNPFGDMYARKLSFSLQAYTDPSGDAYTVPPYEYPSEDSKPKLVNGQITMTLSFTAPNLFSGFKAHAYAGKYDVTGIDTRGIRVWPK